MYYKIYYVHNGQQFSLPTKYFEEEQGRAETIVRNLNKGRDKNDPYYWLDAVNEVIKVH